jgi:hypothetical protein
MSDLARNDMEKFQTQRTPKRIVKIWRPTLVLAAAILAGLPVSPVPAGERAVYRGTLEGAGEIIMELEKMPPEEGQALYSGRYFYPFHGVDIPLRGTLDRLLESVPRMESATGDDLPESTGEGVPDALWQGRVQDAVFQGEREDARNGVKHAFRLERVAEYDHRDEYPRRIDMRRTPYEYLKLKDHAVPAGEIVGDEAVAYHMWRDPRSKLRYPRLARHPDPEVFQKINALLEQSHWESTLLALECQAAMYDSSPGARPGSPGHGGDEVSVTYLTVTLMSVIKDGRYHCGGTGPSDYFSPSTFDLIRGEHLDWNRLFRAFKKDEHGYKELSPEVLKFIAYLDQDGRYHVAGGMAEEHGVPGFGGDWAAKGENRRDASFIRNHLTLYFVEPGKLNLVISGGGRCCTFSNGPYYSVPFSELKNHS